VSGILREPPCALCAGDFLGRKGRKEDAKNAEGFRGKPTLRALRILCVLCELIFQTAEGNGDLLRNQVFDCCQLFHTF
jgi:hypothetical protein